MLGAIFAIGGIINYFDGRSILAAVLQVSVTVFMAVAQLLCERHGEKGKRIFRYICIAMIVLLVVSVLILIL